MEALFTWSETWLAPVAIFMMITCVGGWFGLIVSQKGDFFEAMAKFCFTLFSIAVWVLLLGILPWIITVPVSIYFVMSVYRCYIKKK